MKKKSLMTALILTAVLTAADVNAQTTTPSTHSTAPAVAVTPSTAAPAVATNVDPALFNLHKQKQLESINEHIARMQKRQACIQASENEKALSTCSGVSEALHPVEETKAAPAAATAAVPAPSVTATAPATATIPASAPATLPVSTPATPVKP